MKTSSRNYPLLLAGQFLGAFGDNAILAVIVGQLTYLNHAGTLSDAGLRTASTLYTSLLFIPYVLLAPLAGHLNDRHARPAGSPVATPSRSPAPSSAPPASC